MDKRSLSGLEQFRAAREIALHMFRTEDGIVKSLASAARYQLALAEASEASAEHRGDILELLDDVAATNAALITAGRRAGASHAKASLLRAALALPSTGYGCQTPCMPSIQTPIAIEAA